ncbi:MAG TPA: NAD(P) transhydrogenase subunit alpha [Candidatus Angelobacter sp.]|jgi:NAD(P) transhydrogenase subunit alpha
MEHLLFHPVGFVAAFFLLKGAPEQTLSPAVLIASLYVFALAAFLGYQVISRVPPLLHTPLMSATNAISGISLIGSIVIAGSHYDQHQMLASILGCAAVTSAMINVTGGFLITDRMLKMFRKKETAKPEEKK